jgi:dTDP-4-amino-4,6-dideoxygalactose transaminase
VPGPGYYFLGEEEEKEVLDVISGWHLSRYGLADNEKFKHKVNTFEKEFAEYIGAKHCVAVSSGTGALLCCLAALGIGVGDEVIVPGYTFIASISTIMLSNATPVLAEIDESLTIDPDDIEKKITSKTKAIMPVHMLGNPCDMDRIMAIAEKHGLYVIEDCCQATGGSFKGKKLGTFGQISAYSLNQFKVITSGDGGMLVTDDYDLYERAFGFHDQGHKPNRLGVEIGKRSIVGMGMRMTELTGAVALAQSRKTDNILKILREKKSKLKNRLGDLKGVAFRRLNDPDGECATLLTLIFDKKESAETFCEMIESKTLINSGWHVYNNMEQILDFKMAGPSVFTTTDQHPVLKAHMLPRTDDILARSVNISIGVVDKGLGAGFGINIHSDDNEIDAVAASIKEMLA